MYSSWVYKKDRGNDEIVEENARITKVVETLLKEHGGSRIKDLPDGPIKDNLITNIRGNNIGVLPRVADAIIASAKKRKTFEEVPSKEELISEAEVEMLKMINNYNPKLNDAIGAYLQSKEFGLMRKLETIRKKVVQGGVKGQKVGMDKMKGQFTEQKHFDLKGDYAENPNRLILRNEIDISARYGYGPETQGPENARKIDMEILAAGCGSMDTLMQSSSSNIDDEIQISPE